MINKKDVIDILNQHLDNDVQISDKNLNTVFKLSNKSKAPLTVIITLATYKILCPDQDICLHKKKLSRGENSGFSARSFDCKFISPFIYQLNSNLAFNESAWTTKTMEQNHPYDLQYPANIKPKDVKIPFLKTILKIQNDPAFPSKVLSTALKYIANESKRADDIKSDILDMLKTESHKSETALSFFNQHHLMSKGMKNKSLLPTIMLWTILKQVDKFSYVSEIGSHNSSDSNSGSVGDIMVGQGKNKISLEVKDGITIEERFFHILKNKVSSNKFNTGYIVGYKCNHKDVINLIEESNFIEYLDLENIIRVLDLFYDSSLLINNYIKNTLKNKEIGNDIKELFKKLK